MEAVFNAHLLYRGQEEAINAYRLYNASWRLLLMPTYCIRPDGGSLLMPTCCIEAGRRLFIYAHLLYKA
jgi:hypothetical protein